MSAYDYEQIFVFVAFVPRTSVLFFEVNYRRIERAVKSWVMQQAGFPLDICYLIKSEIDYGIYIYVKKVPVAK